MPADRLLVTRRSLVDRLQNWEDQRTWQEFFDAYWRLIYGAARKAGLGDAEAQDVVQETILTVARRVDGLHYDPARGSFKGWLLHITRWRVADQFRKRARGGQEMPREDDTRRTAAIDRIPGEEQMDEYWEREWQQNLLDAALERVKKKVDARQFQIFHCYTKKEWPAKKVALELGVNIGQVYLARHRVLALIKKEVRELEARGV